MARAVNPSAYCPMDVSLNILNGKWKLAVLWQLTKEPSLRFNELQRRLGRVTQKTLTAQLRELERDGVIFRTVYAEMPPKVEYCLTERGKAARGILDALCAWGKTFD